MRRSRRSQAKVTVNVHTNENINASSATKPAQSRKRTLSSIQDTSTQASTTGPNARASESKMARLVGPPHARPLQLELGEGNQEETRGEEVTIDKGKGKANAESFYPGRDRDDNNIAPFPADSDHFTDSNDGDTDIEREEDWLAEPQPLEPSTRNSSKISEALAIERPIWKNPTVPTPISNPVDNGGPSNHSVAPEPAQSVWPAETELLFFPGTNKVMLTVQRPLMRMVIQGAFDEVQKSLMFHNAFPDTFIALDFTRDAILAAAESFDQASDIYNRLVTDAEYMNKMTRLPRARIPLFRAEVKDRCVAIVQAEFLSIGSKSAVAQLAQKQLADYNYTFPTVANGNPLNYLAKRTRPYRNPRIISVIRDLYFSGRSSFARHYRTQFPLHEHENETMKREVPIPMVALVATALYAAIQEWSTGKHKAVEFSANTYLDVYKGNVNTFYHIRDNRTEAFHIMMSDIYSQAGIMVSEESSAPIATLELSDIVG